MPYIKPEDRPKFDEASVKIGTTAECAGDLNYAITVIAHTYLKKKGIRYANINEVMGALECCKLEIYRKIAANYEDEKAISNGDIGLL